jgi:methylmalonyl-CoA mutase, N-terminal domain
MATTEDPRSLSKTEAWRAEQYESSPERQGELFSTISGIENEPLYAPDKVEIDYERDLGYPGAYPFTRGVYPSMYRGRLWTMRQFAGFGTAAETNERFRYLLDHGQTGLSTAFDMPTLMGYDSDHPRSLGEVGREGVAIDSLADMQTLFAGIPLGEVSTSMTINSPAAMLLAFYVCVGEEQGVPRDQLRGTIQTDILKEYIAQKEFIFPPEPSMRLVTDMIEFCARELPKWHPISISGYHIREARPRRRSSPSRLPTVSRTSTGRSSAASTSTTLRRGCPSSSTRTSTSSRRSRSTARRGGSGRASCATGTTHGTRGHG